jgi:hypothetical protein
MIDRILRKYPRELQAVRCFRLITPHRLIISLLVCGAFPGTPSVAQHSPPKFEDYPATDKLIQPLKSPILHLPVDDWDKDHISKGVLYGEGLVGVDKPDKPPKPNFAGAFFAIAWNCGSDGCIALALVDSRTGIVYGPPPTAVPPKNGFVASARTNECEGIGLRPDSRLLFLDYAEWNSGRPLCQRSYYEWRDHKYWFLGRRSIRSRL